MTITATHTGTPGGDAALATLTANGIVVHKNITQVGGRNYITVDTRPNGKRRDGLSVFDLIDAANALNAERPQ